METVTQAGVWFSGGGNVSYLQHLLTAVLCYTRTLRCRLVAGSRKPPPWIAALLHFISVVPCKVCAACSMDEFRIQVR